MTTNRLRQVALERAVLQNYLVDPADGAAVARVQSLPPHPRWHGPLLVACDGAELERRIAEAGALWLSCHDLSPDNALAIDDLAAGASHLFQRVQRPRGAPVALGPIDGAFAAGGERVGPNAIRCQVFRDPMPTDELDAVLATITDADPR